eukprot:1566285-Alexandrium_andersonii.AAC.1
MSASLVGSEMCIRDRIGAVQPSGWGFSLRLAPGGAAAPSGPPPAPRRGGPVSYTHLTLPTICSV